MSKTYFFFSWKKDVEELNHKYIIAQQYVALYIFIYISTYFGVIISSQYHF